MIGGSFVQKQASFELYFLLFFPFSYLFRCLSAKLIKWKKNLGSIFAQKQTSSPQFWKQNQFKKRYWNVNRKTRLRSANSNFKQPVILWGKMCKNKLPNAQQQMIKERKFIRNIILLSIFSWLSIINILEFAAGAPTCLHRQLFVLNIWRSECFDDSMSSLSLLAAPPLPMIAAGECLPHFTIKKYNIISIWRRLRVGIFSVDCNR